MGNIKNIEQKLAENKKSAANHIAKVKARINKVVGVRQQTANVLITQFIGIEIEKGSDHRYGQILRNLDVVKEVRDKDGMPVNWENDYEVSSQDILARLGNLTEIKAAIKKHYKNHSGFIQSSANTDRQASNRAINHMLMTAVQAYPNWSFPKILRHLEITREDLFSDFNDRKWINEFNTESNMMLSRVRNYKEIIERVRKETE